MCSRPAVLAWLLVAVPAVLSAQRASPQIGERIRLEVRPAAQNRTLQLYHSYQTGRLIAFDGRDLLLLDEKGDSLRLARERIRRVQVWAGTGPSTARGLGQGLLLGGLAGGIVGAIKVAGICDESDACGGGMAVGFLLGFGAGAALGGFLGVAAGSQVPRDRWRDSRLPEGPVTP